jgi:hypothetical protein
MTVTEAVLGLQHAAPTPSISIGTAAAPTRRARSRTCRTWRKFRRRPTSLSTDTGTPGRDVRHPPDPYPWVGNRQLSTLSPGWGERSAAQVQALMGIAHR